VNNAGLCHLKRAVFGQKQPLRIKGIANMKNGIAVSIITISLASPAIALAGDDFKFDRNDAASYAAGMLKSLLHSAWAKQSSPKNFDFTKPITESVKSSNNKRYVFVGYKNIIGNGGFEVIFQVCDNNEPNSWVDYAMADYGLVFDLNDGLVSLRTLRKGGPGSLVIPDACPKSDRD
jgi:hypothetical protein